MEMLLSMLSMEDDLLEHDNCMGVAWECGVWGGGAASNSLNGWPLVEA